MKVLAVVPTYLSEPGELEVIEVCLRTLRDTAPDAEVLVVDDGSPHRALVDELAGICARLESELVVQPSNEGFSATVNVGLRRALESGQDAVLVNADIEFFESGWLERMVAQPTTDGEGLASVVGALLLYPSGLIQHGGVFFSLLHRVFDHRFRYGPGDLPEAQRAFLCPVTGALQLIRHEALTEVGIYDEEFRLGWEDVDYCLRVFQSGRECVYQPKVRAFHHESLFRGRPSPRTADWQARSWVYFTRKWASVSFAEYVPTAV